MGFHSAAISGSRAAGALLLLSAALRAEPATTPLRIQYAEVPGCPTTDALLSGIQARYPKARRATTEADASLLVLSVSSVADESRGHLMLRTPDGKESERDVTGDTCEEVVSALALVAALALDGSETSAVTSSGAAETTNPPVPAVPAAPAPGPAPVVAPAAMSPKELPASPVPAAADTAASERAGSGAPGRWHVATRFRVALESGVAPDPILGTVFGLEVSAPRGSLLSPTFHASFERGARDARGAAGEDAAFTWTLGLVEACPHRFVVGAVALEPCARFEAGVVEATGRNVVPSRTDEHAWVGLGALGRAQWNFLSPLFLEVEGGARAPFARTTYFFRPDTFYYRPPAVGATVGVGVGARFL